MAQPSFLVEPYLSLFRVDEESGSLSNTDGVMGTPSDFLAKGKVRRNASFLPNEDEASVGVVWSVAVRPIYSGASPHVSSCIRFMYHSRVTQEEGHALGRSGALFFPYIFFFFIFCPTFLHVVLDLP